MITVFTYGIGSEYSLGPLVPALRHRGLAVIELADRTRSEIAEAVRPPRRGLSILLTSEHPFLPRFAMARFQASVEPYFVSLADLLSLRRFDAVAFLSHDPADEVQQAEDPVMADVDAVFVHNPAELARLRGLVPVLRAPRIDRPPVDASGLRWLFMPTHFEACGADTSTWLSRFPFLARGDGAVKLPTWPGVEAAEQALRRGGVNVLANDLRPEQLLGSFTGIVIATGFSGILADAQRAGVPAVVWREEGISEMELGRYALRWGARVVERDDELPSGDDGQALHVSTERRREPGIGAADRWQVERFILQLAWCAGRHRLRDSLAIVRLGLGRVCTIPHRSADVA